MTSEALNAIRSGQIVGIPTDTVYGLGVDPLQEEALSRLFDLKDRPQHRPVGLLVATIEQAKMIGELGEDGESLARSHWPGALTLVVTPVVVLTNWVGDALLRTVGLRVPDHLAALEVLEETGPLAVTSANRSGAAETLSDTEARAIFHDQIPVYVEGICPRGEASTVVDVTGRRPVVLREGPITI